MSVFMLVMAGCGNSEKQNQYVEQTGQTDRDTSIQVNNNMQELTDTADRVFFKGAAIANIFETELSSRILIVTESEEVKKYARQILSDQVSAGKDLSMLAKKNGVDLPTLLPDEKIGMVKNIDIYNQEGKNAYYAKRMVEHYVSLIDLFNKISTSQDSQTKQFAAKSLVMLKSHLIMSEKLQQDMTSHKRNQGDDPLQISDKYNMKPNGDPDKKNL